MKSVIDAVIRARGNTPTMPEHSPARSSGSNGVVERGIKEVQGQLRAMKSALDARVGVDVRGTSNILPWMVEYASVLINRYVVGKDGKTAYERLRGKKSKMLGFEFGERVHFRRIPLQGRLGKLDSLWQTRLFVGYRTQSGEYMVANSEGAYKTRTMKRMPETERWDKSRIEGMPLEVQVERRRWERRRGRPRRKEHERSIRSAQRKMLRLIIQSQEKIQR